jgi:hypothetical protein
MSHKIGKHNEKNEQKSFNIWLQARKKMMGNLKLFIKPNKKKEAADTEKHLNKGKLKEKPVDKLRTTKWGTDNEANPKLPVNRV